jgi:hypothetical protein
MRGAPGTKAFSLFGQPQFLRGFAYGLRYPCLRVGIALAGPSTDSWLDRANTALAEALPEYGCGFTAERIDMQPGVERQAVAALLHWLQALQDVASLPVFEQGRLIAHNRRAGTVFVALPTTAHAGKATFAALRWLMKVCNAAASGTNLGEQLAGLPAVLEVLRAVAPVGSNVPRLWRAAHDAGIPVVDIAAGVLQ